ncbi:peptide ABC transporter permease [Longispora fulva]|uniref:Peptide/nickel transport system permease protein n=1 Tax=Longispora fulva TaxID=619741 RepID=A0A8J7GEH8_9ACTN|nr:ABC transporter permease subunit [Longispora fulva]MBG6136390.1 peptide/nickel transport system permease protein [Longispora fulva]GIG59558.1 peptide ABC transporter permease [Longispora fulva]
MRGRTVVAGALVAVPVAVAVAGPAFAPLTTTRRDIAYWSGPGHLLGTDFLGRDVLGLVLRGGTSVLLLAAAATLVAYAAGALLGLAAAGTRRRWLDELAMRPLDVLLAVPALLVLLLVASLTDRGVGMVVAVVAVVNTPAIARLVRAAALDAIRRPAAEAMVLQGEPRWRVYTVFVAREIARPLAADAGTRLTTAVYLVGAANFLGVGLPPGSADWAVLVDRNRAGLLLQPWAVLAPALLIVALTVGVNLLADDLTRRRR